MKSVESTGKTVDDAIAAALNELGVEKDKTSVEIIQKGSTGLFGLLGSKLARVRVIVEEDISEIAVEVLDDIIDLMGIDVDIETDWDEETLNLEMKGEEIGILIGKRGNTLDAIQYIVSLICNKARRDREWVRIVVDAEGYRKRREQTLKNLALRLADKVRNIDEKVVLEPMTPQERRIIHITLKEVPDVKTFSQGEDPYRKVVIAPN